MALSARCTSPCHLSLLVPRPAPLRPPDAGGTPPGAARAWRRAMRAERGGDDASVPRLTVPEPGVYYLFARMDELDKGCRDQHYLVLRTVDPDEAAATDGGEGEDR